jgi:hypothetical protein
MADENLPEPLNCGANELAQQLFEQLGKDLSVEIPEIDFNSDDFKFPNEDGPLYGDITPLTIDVVTERKLKGNGSLDAIMEAVSVHLEDQYKKNRITGQMYADAYIALIQAAIAGGIQYALGKDQAYWQAIQTQMLARKAQLDAISAKVELATAQVSYATAVSQMGGMEATYALTKMKLATEDAEYCNKLAQKKVLDEQYEVARSQTTGTRSNGDPVEGTVGAQITLYGKQANAYDRDVDYKIGKMLMDQWIAQKSIDEGLTAPTQFTNANIDEVFATIRSNADI